MKHLALSGAIVASINNSGFVGGGQIGVNAQIAAVVFGLEADFEYFNPKGSITTSGTYPQFPTQGFTFNQSVSGDWLFTFRPRVGLALGTNWLVYATGGLAVAELKFTQSFADTFFCPANFGQGCGAGTGTTSQVKAGVTGGGGVEFKLSSDWSVRAEYLYLQFDHLHGGYGFCGASATPCDRFGTFNNSVGFHEHLVRGAINFKL